MDWWTDLWSFLTALGTIAMAGTTLWIILQDREQGRDAERQHRDQFKPICVLTPYDRVDPAGKRGDLIALSGPSQASQNHGEIWIYCLLQNIGCGPALKLRIKFRFPHREGWCSDPWELAPLGADEEHGGEGAPLKVPFRFTETFNATDFSLIPTDLWEIWLEYEDVFGRPFQSIHSKAPVNADLSKAIWTRIAGEQPKATMPPIPWFSYHEGQMK